MTGFPTSSNRALGPIAACALALLSLAAPALSLTHDHGEDGDKPRARKATRQKSRYNAAMQAIRERYRRSPKDLQVLVDLARLERSVGKFGLAKYFYDQAIRLDSAKLMHGPRAELAQLLHDAGKYGDALPLWNEAIELAPGFAGLLVGRGRTYEALKRTEEAREAYEKATGLQPELLDAWLALAGLHYAAGRYNRAIQACTAARKFAPKSAQLFYNLALALTAASSKHNPAALIFARRAAALAPQAPEPLVLLGRLLIERHGRKGAARKLFERAAELNRYWAPPYRELAALDREAGRREPYMQAIVRLAHLGSASEPQLREVLAHARAAGNTDLVVISLRGIYQLKPDDTANAHELAKLYWKRLRPLDAIRIWEQIRKSDPEHAGASAALAGFIMSDTWTDPRKRVERLNEAREMLEQALAAHPDDVRLLQRLARLEVGQDQPDKARALLLRAVSSKPDDPKLLDALGQVYFLLNRWSDAEDVYREAIRHDSKSRGLRLKLAGVLLRIGSLSDCLALLDPLLKDDPKWIGARELKGMCLYQRRDYAGAIEHWEAVRRLAPTRTEILAKLADAYIKEGRGDKALPLLQEYLKRHINDIPALTALADLYEKAGRLREAASIRRQIVQLKPDNVQARERRDRIEKRLEKETEKPVESPLHF